MATELKQVLNGVGQRVEQREATARNEFERLAMRLSQGETVDPDEIVKVLAGAHRSAEVLEAEVLRLKERKELLDKLERFDELTAELPRIEEAIQAEQARHEKAMAELKHAKLEVESLKALRPGWVQRLMELGDRRLKQALAQATWERDAKTAEWLIERQLAALDDPSSQPERQARIEEMAQEVEELSQNVEGLLQYFIT